jgi:WhiB family redox-sensing transcriptional regulator
MSAHREPGWVSLLAEILRGAPRLDGGLCRDRSLLFDAEHNDEQDREYATARAIELCRQCPCLAACRAWADAQPRGRLSGVVGGEVRQVRPSAEAKRKKPKRPRPKPKPRPAAVPA